MGFRPPRQIQAAGMDGELRNSIWNLLFIVFEPDGWGDLARPIAINVLKVPAQDVPGGIPYFAQEWLFARYARMEWYRIYDLLEYVAGRDDLLRERKTHSSTFVAMANAVLERELSGFRFVRGRLSRLTSQAEVDAIEEAARTAGRAGLGGVETHLDDALRLLGLRPKPDYRNSVKESISAVESAVKSISGHSGGGLAGALEALAKRTYLHPAMKDGFNKLYAYTSDDDGIRHAILDAPTVGHDEAKFMLVSCSAFCHFLISKAEAAGLLKS